MRWLSACVTDEGPGLMRFVEALAAAAWADALEGPTPADRDPAGARQPPVGTAPLRRQPLCGGGAGPRRASRHYRTPSRKMLSVPRDKLEPEASELPTMKERSKDSEPQGKLRTREDQQQLLSAARPQRLRPQPLLSILTASSPAQAPQAQDPLTPTAQP
uniref:uncharacterized protein LOC118143820 isoform X3 n=1 Tax=Callithrix jacchus TaxID=9483 RepID=UPI0023DD32AD|nr:uncharacterized protein LOC118143820 isoform X3 [Callithrix jacchus]